MPRFASRTSSPFLTDEAHQRRAANDEAALVQGLAQLYMAGVIDIFVDRPRLTLTVTQKPAATPLARYQATQGGMAINRAHRNVALDAAERLILSVCDGSRDAAGIFHLLAEQPKEPGGPIEREADARESWQRHVAIGLPKLAQAGFF